MNPGPATSGQPRREVDALAVVEGDPEHPVLEPAAFTEWGWFNPAQLRRLAAGQEGGHAGMVELALDAIRLLEPGAPAT